MTDRALPIFPLRGGSREIGKWAELFRLSVSEDSTEVKAIKGGLETVQSSSIVVTETSEALSNEKVLSGETGIVSVVTAAGTVKISVATMTGDSGSGGVKGLVPAPSGGDAGKYFNANGTYTALPKSAEVADLGQTISGVYSQSEIQTLSDKMDELLAALRAAGLLET